MDFWQVLKNRHCVRDFDSDKPVTDEQIDKLLQAAKMAPSAGDTQDWEFKVVKDHKTKAELVKATFSGQNFILQAPVVIVVCSDLKKIEQAYGQRGKELYAVQDTAAATENLLLAATALGIGTCWVGAFDEKEVKEVLALAENLRPLVIIPIGYSK